MAIAKITGQGLMWIATLVIILWCFILTESLVIRHARAEAQRSMNDLRVLRFKRQAEPAALPIRPKATGRPAVG